MALVGFRYIDTNQPAPSVGYQWYNPSNGNLYESNISATAWVLIGNASNANYGLVPKTGATMTGALLGVTGWAPEDSPDFKTAAKRKGINLVDQNELAAAIQALEDMIDSKVSKAISSVVQTTLTIGNNIAFTTGELTPTPNWDSIVNIPKPTFSDRTIPDISQCTVMVAPADWGTATVEIGGSGTLVQSVVKQSGTILQYQSYNVTSIGNYPMKMRYLVIAQR